VAHFGEKRCTQGFGAEKIGEKPCGRPSCRWRIILKCMRRNLVGRTWTGLIWLRVSTSGRPL